MKTDKLCEHIRARGEPLRVDSVIIDTGKTTFKAHGTLKVEDDSFLLRLTVEEGKIVMPKGTFTYDQFWKITGAIDDEVPFVARGLPSSVTNGFGPLVYQKTFFRVHDLSLTELTEIEQEEQQRILEELFQGTNLADSNAPVEAEPIEAEPIEPAQKEPDTQQVVKPCNRYSCEARLVSFPLIWKNAYSQTTQDRASLGTIKNSTRDTLHGSFDGGEFVLREEEEDCMVYLYASDKQDMNAESFQKTVDSLLHGIAFVFGRDAWPQEIRIQENRATLKHVLTAPHRTSRSRAPLLTSSACFNGADVVEAIKCATTFFLSGLARMDDILTLLYLTRNAASARTPHEVGTLALCSIFEGIVDLLHELYCRDDVQDKKAEFEQAKAMLLSDCEMHSQSLGTISPGKAEAFGRLKGLISSAKFARVKEKLVQLVEHFGLKWNGCLEVAFQSWQENRHPMAHGRLSTQGHNSELDAQGRIGGGINFLIAAAMGYRGLAAFSQMEGNYQRL